MHQQPHPINDSTYRLNQIEACRELITLVGRCSAYEGRCSSIDGQNLLVQRLQARSSGTDDRIPQQAVCWCGAILLLQCAFICAKTGGTISKKTEQFRGINSYSIFGAPSVHHATAFPRNDAYRVPAVDVIR